MRQLDLFGNVIKTTSAEENYPVMSDAYTHKEYEVVALQNPERAGRELTEEQIFDTTKAVTMQNLNMTGREHTQTEMPSEPSYNDNQANQTFSVTEVSNAEKAATESLQ